MNFFPYSTPQILTDAIFTANGGHVGTSTNAQRQAAFLIAEETVSEDMDTYLIPVIVTGTYPYQSRLTLDHAYIRQVFSVKFMDFERKNYFTVTGLGNIYVNLLSSERGILDISPYCNLSHSHNQGIAAPYQVDVVYETGLSSGTSYDPKILLGASTYADIALNEIVGYGNEAPGDAGVESFSNQQYREQRKALINTVFGNSARAQFVHKLLTKYRQYRYVSL